MPRFATRMSRLPVARPIFPEVLTEETETVFWMPAPTIYTSLLAANTIDGKVARTLSKAELHRARAPGWN
jgi:hypothetical protein